MADTANTSFPVIPVKHWWALRERFKKSIPAVVNESYLASVLDMTDASARANVLPSLKYTRIVDDDGKPTDRAVKWRDDTHYSSVCEEIRKEVYPQELLDVAHDPENDKEKARRWFANTTGSGVNAVRKMLAVYLILLDADVSKSTDGPKSPSAKKVSGPRQRKPSLAQGGQKSVDRPDDVLNSNEDSNKNDRLGTGPTLHLNIQIHISPEFSPDQIDQIFASMAKHLKTLSE